MAEIITTFCITTHKEDDVIPGNLQKMLSQEPIFFDDITKHASFLGCHLMIILLVAILKLTMMN